MLPLIFLVCWWVPEHAIVKECIGVLNLIGAPSRVPIHSVAIGSLNIDLVLLLMFYSWCSIRTSRNGQSKRTKFVFLGSEFFPVPTIEVTKDCDTLGSGSPLFVMDITIRLYIQSILLIRSANI